MKKLSRCRLIAKLVSIAFVVYSLVPLFVAYSPSVQAALSKKQAELFSGKVLVCTPSGLKWVELSIVGDEVDSDIHQQFKCPLCFLSGKVSDLFCCDVSGADFFVNQLAGYYSFYSYGAYSVFEFYARPFSRGPPAFSLVS